MSPATIVIKKYPNRRLYDTSTGRYVNLDDVALLIRRGADVQVVDARTGEDLTSVVLTQIIVEDAKGRPAALPVDLLRQLVMATDKAWSDVRSAALSPLHMVKNLLTAEPSASQAEVEQLRQRISELESKMKPRKPPRKRKGQ